MASSKKSRKPKSGKRFFHRYPITTLCVFTVAAIVSLIGVGEAICYKLMHKEEPKPVEERTCDADGKCTMQIEFGNGQKAAPVRETMDRFDRRVVPGIPRTGDKFLAFFGCSFTFGEGVNDDETLPYYFSKHYPGYRVYNYGNRGAGPHYMLSRLQDPKIHEQIPEKKGIGFYVYMDGHVPRAIGTMRNFWTDDQPYYTWGDGDKVVQNGTFETGRWFITGLYKILRKSWILSYFDVDFPPRLRDGHFRLAAAMITALRDDFKMKFNSDEFYVLFYPGSSERLGPPLIPFLKEFNVPYFEHFNLDVNKLVGEKASLPDGHPTAKLHKAIADMFEKDIQQFRGTPKG